MSLLPSATSVVNLADSHDRATFNMVATMKEEPMDVESLENKEEVNCAIALASGSKCPPKQFQSYS